MVSTTSFLFSTVSKLTSSAKVPRTPRVLDRVPHIFSPDFNVGKRIPLSRDASVKETFLLVLPSRSNLGSLQAKMKDSGTYNFTIRDKRMIRVRILKLDPFFLSFSLSSLATSKDGIRQVTSIVQTRSAFPRIGFFFFPPPLLFFEFFSSSRYEFLPSSLISAPSFNFHQAVAG